MDIAILPHSTLLEILPSRLADNDTQLETLEQIFTRLMSNGQSPVAEKEAKQLLQIVSANISPSPAVTKMFADFLLCYENPLLIVDVISAIVGDSAQEILLVLEKYAELVKDRTYLVPVIGSLSELPLKEDMKNQVFELATQALQIADETDVPTITRTLLRTITKGNFLTRNNLSENSQKVIQHIRKEAENISLSTSSLLLEVIGNALRVNTIAVNSFLSVLQSSSLTNLDLYIIIVLISRVNTRKKALSAFSRAMLQESISLESLKTVFSHVIVLEQHTHSLVMICQFLLILGTKSPRLLEWAIDLFSSTFIHYPSARSEIVSSLLSACSNNGAKEYPSAITAARSVLRLAKNNADVFSNHSSLLEELLHYSNSLNSEIFHMLCSSLSHLCLHKEGLVTTLFIYVQKQLFCGNDYSQKAEEGLICASHILKVTNISPNDITTLANWTLRCINTCDASSLAFIFDLLSYNVDKFSKETQRDVYIQCIIPALSFTQVFFHFPDIPRQQLSSEPNETFFAWNQNDSQNKQTIPVIKLLNIEAHVLSLQPTYLSTLFNCFLQYYQRLHNPNLEKLVDTGIIVPSFMFPVGLQSLQMDSGGDITKKMISKYWRAFYALSINLVLLKYTFDSFKAQVSSNELVKNILSFRIRATLSCHTLTHKWYAKICSYCDQKEISDSSLEQLNVVRSTQIPSIPAEFIFSAIESIEQTLSQDYAVHIYSMLFFEMWTLFIGKEDTSSKQVGNNIQFIPSESIDSFKTVEMLLQLAVDTEVGSWLVSRTKSLAEEVVEGRRHAAYEAVKNPELKEIADKKWESSMYLLAYHYRIVSLLLHFSKKTTLHKILIRSFCKHICKEQEDIACLSKLFQYYASQLHDIEDAVLAVLILDILACLTEGLKKSNVVGLLSFKSLKTLYPTTKTQLLLGRLPTSLLYLNHLSKRIMKNITPRFLLTMVFKLCNTTELVSDALCEIVFAMHEFSIDNAKENKNEHDLLIQLNSESFPIFFEITLQNIQKVIPATEIKKEEDLQILCMWVILAVQIVEFYTAPNNPLSSSQSTQVFIQMMSLILQDISKKVEANWSVVVDESMPSLDILLYSSRLLMEKLRQFGQTLKSESQKGKRQVKDLVGVPKLISKLEAFSSFLEQTPVSAENIEDEYQKIVDELSNTTVPEIDCDETGEDNWSKQPNKIPEETEDYDYFDYADRSRDETEDSFFAEFHGNAPENAEKTSWNTIFVTLGDGTNKKQKT